MKSFHNQSPRLSAPSIHWLPVIAVLASGFLAGCNPSTGPTSQAVSASAASAAASAASAAAAPASADTVKVRFEPPAPDSIPNDEMGALIRKGEQIFLHTKTNAGQYVGKDSTVNCVSCHLDAGRQANSAPLWGAYGMYPAYRKKTNSVNDFAERLQGCFMYSMNGKAPARDSDVMQALQAYAWWMSKNAPVGVKLPGAGYPKIPDPKQAPDFARGETVYKANCAVCHGNNGEGQRSGDQQVFPPLWGKASYNWGAGMHEIDKAAYFIHANMPFSKGGSLTEQEAWDVAYYINSHERPQDPRYKGDIAATRKEFHDTKWSLYGQEVNGALLGKGTR